LLVALARAPHDRGVRDALAAGYRRTRPALAGVLGLPAGDDGEAAAGLVLAMFNGLLFQAQLDPALAIEGKRMEGALAGLGGLLP
jgi:hypothetical protein